MKPLHLLLAYCSILILFLSACMYTPQTTIAPKNTNANRSEANVHIENLLPTPLVSQPVAQPKVTEIRTVQQELALAEGEQKLLVAEVVLSDGTQNNRDIMWASSNTRIVSISTTGLAERLDTGEVTITAISRQDPGFRLDIKILDTPAAKASLPPVVQPTDLIPSATPIPLPEPLPTHGPLPEPSPSGPPPASPGPSASPSTSEPTSNPDPSISPSATAPQSTPTPTSSLLQSSSLGMNFVNIPAGSFMMGQADISDASPVHSVTLSAFQMQTTEVTQKQWWDVMGFWPGDAPGDLYGMGDNYPMYRVSWCDIVGKTADNNCPNEDSFLKRLNQDYVGTYRLPTEAEWEYAARAGTTTAYACGEYIAGTSGCPGTMAWFNETVSDFSTKPVGTKQPNAWGLYDMHGNVMEWVHDWYTANYYSHSPSNNPTGPATGTFRSLRGGSWDNASLFARSASRVHFYPVVRGSNAGFRVVREP